jgi:hypothetical protein
VTAEDCVNVIVDFGFTERQARFLELVIRHAGVCVPRQYASFAGIANGGKKCNALFDKLIRRGYAVACDCVHNRARTYHVHHKPLYRAIGEPESRYRRPVPARRAVERLMLLDAVLTTPDLTWLITAAEKLSFGAAQSRQPPSEEPAGVFVDTRMRVVGGFPTMFPIGIDPNGGAVLLYLVTEPAGDQFRAFLQTQAALLRAVSAWTLRLIFPRPLDRMYSAYQQVIHEELETPLHRATINELKWYFEHRQKAASSPADAQTRAFLNRAAQVYGTPRFTMLYRRWLKQGDTVFDPLAPPVIAEGLAAGTARVECLVLPHTYRHLSPLVNRVRGESETVVTAASIIPSTMSSTSAVV